MAASGGTQLGRRLRLENVRDQLLPTFLANNYAVRLLGRLMVTTIQNSGIAHS